MSVRFALNQEVTLAEREVMMIDVRMLTSSAGKDDVFIFKRLRESSAGVPVGDWSKWRRIDWYLFVDW